MIDVKIKEVISNHGSGRLLVHDELGAECGFCDLINSFLNAEAGRRMAEFKLEHVDCQSGPAYDPDGAPCKCEDERHIWGLADWRAELERELDT